MNLTKKTLRIYQDCNGREPFSDWIGTLTAGDRARVIVRLDRVETGNPGDHRSVGEDVYESDSFSVQDTKYITARLTIHLSCFSAAEISLRRKKM